MIETKKTAESAVSTRADLLALFKSHGGQYHGPHVEHAYIEQQAFWRFLDEIVEQNHRIITERDDEIRRFRAASAAAIQSITRFPGSVHDRAMAKLEKAMGKSAVYEDPDEARADRAEAALATASAIGFAKGIEHAAKTVEHEAENGTNDPIARACGHGYAAAIRVAIASIAIGKK